MGLSDFQARLALGTVQFGLNYGISNNAGKPGMDEVKKILDLATQVGIELLDTAPAYGTSEQIIGELLPHNDSFKIVTKTPALNADYDINQQIEYSRHVFSKSLDYLKRSSVYGLLVHRVDDLMALGGERLWAVLEDLKEKGYVSKIGVSVYTGDQIDKVIARYPIDLIQLPINIFDQRLIKSGHLTILKSMGIEIHARSVFLQGLLLMDPATLPSYFVRFQSRLFQYHNTINEYGISPVQAALGFVASLLEIDSVICGVNNHLELQDLCDALDYVQTIDFHTFACDDEALINPSQWNVAA